MNNDENWSNRHSDADVLEAARATIQRAEAGQVLDGIKVIEECTIALRDITNCGELPDAERILYLAALLKSLEQIIDGVNPARALCIEKDRGRPAHANKLDHEVAVYLAVGMEYDALRVRGHTREDAPVEAAVNAAAKKFGATPESVQKIWSEFGATEKWRSITPD